jgi:MFS superfamily sulfate permease-like transporter
MTNNDCTIPRGDLAGFKRYWRADLLSGFLVFLIALPLSLGISIACGYPPLAGIFTAILGSLLAPFLSNSELTVKGPAAGLIVIAIGCIQDFGGDGMIGGFSGDDVHAYKAALAVGVAAAVLQIVFSLLRGGILGDFFPGSVVHGMLAAIGVIIMLKQFPVALGVEAKGEPLELLRSLPEIIREANPAIAAIGAVSLAIMFLWPLAGKKAKVFKTIPSPIVVLLAAVPLGLGFDLLHRHYYIFEGHKYELGGQYLIAMPKRIFGMFQQMTPPDFTALAQLKAWKWVVLFFIIGSLESLLSTKAIDLLDPWKRKTNLNRDVLAIGLGNLLSALIGGLPMISEIVRSKANIDNGARTRFAALWHGVLLLVCVALIPTVLHQIPLAALAAMLVYTGFRLAHPSEFLYVYRIGREQLVIFVATLLAVLATDLLIGVLVGIAVKILIHVMNGLPLSSVFKPSLEIERQGENTCLIRAHRSAVFSNWIPFRRQLEDLGLVQRQNLVLDFSDTKLVDHTTMEKLHDLQREFERENLKLDIIGLDIHRQLSGHPLAARKRTLATVKRITVVTDPAIVDVIVRKSVELGISGYTLIPCQGAGRQQMGTAVIPCVSRIKLEVIVLPALANPFLDFLRRDVMPTYPLTACVETVHVLRADDFSSTGTARPDRLAPADPMRDGLEPVKELKE